MRKGENGQWIMDGELTIRGISKPTPLQFIFRGIFPDAEQGEQIPGSFHATTAVKRGDFGMTRDNAMELGPNPMGPDVEIEIDVEATRSVAK